MWDRYCVCAVLCCGVVFAWGCAHPRITAAAILEKGQADIVAATSELKDKTVVVEGVVQSKDVAHLNAVGLRGFVWGPFVSAGQTVERTSLPVVYLEPDGLVACVFAEDEMSKVAKLQIGDHAVLECKFRQFQTKDGHRLALLGECEITE